MSAQQEVARRLVAARKKIKAQVTEIERDARYKSGKKKPATVFENAPLALIQLELETRRAALIWALSLLAVAP